MDAMAQLPLPAGLGAGTFPAKLWSLVNDPRVRSLRWDSEARGLLVDRSLFERELLRPGGAQGPAPHAFRATQFRSFVRQLYRYGFRKGFHGEQLLPPRWEGPRSRMQELYGEQPPPLDRELLWMQPCSFQQLHREQQPPASNPPAAAGTSAPHAPAGSAGCAASTASSSAQNAPAQEESPALDLGQEIEKMIREIRNSLPVKAPSAQGNINVAPESPGEDPMNRAEAEEVSSGTESCRNSSPEPEEPGLHGQSEEMSNSSSISHFLLLALADTRQLQLLHFCLFLGISLAALLGNGLIISAVACGHHLHTPMFFFLLNLALTDLGSILTTVPKAMHNSLWDTRNISYTGCAAQLFFFLFFISAEYYHLTVMCYDRYVSICKPLHYGTLLGSRACAHMAAAAWASAFLNALMHTANTFSLPLCHGNALGQFFCEIPQILKLSCSHSNLREFGLLAVSACLALGCFVFIVFSYVQIFRAVLRIPSEQGQHKAFSTCLPHLAVLSLFLSTVMFANLKPPSISSPSLDLALSVLYSVVPLVLNPLIYSLRNKELKAAVWRLMTGWFRRH
ncbi:hypothetical protein DUI87_26016 [Hirundo rustica rustica]|uniref:G-protein coupled receptors family 1 profile domain-containing protein n=1 Tax=Hirundo rustica rustica TaxID=333673 RepID=A0A3M0J9B8_HIRRU|nr:hypothetical protein DUI87_26016 [Hirundo rustica rustica]